MLHHYPAKTKLLAAAVEHLLSRRLAEFSDRFNTSLLANEHTPTSGELDDVISTLWTIYSGPTLSAWLELVVASRTDPDLLDAMSGVNARFHAAAEVTFARLFGSEGDSKARPAARLVMAVFDGLALNLVLEGNTAVGSEAAALFRTLIEPWRRQGFGSETTQ
jgi:AcrR family transcriptional regulator